MTLEERQHQAAGLIVEMIADNGREIHPETAIQNAARMAGSLLFRAFEIGPESAKPGEIVLSDEANELGAQFEGMLAGALMDYGVELNEDKLEMEFEMEAELSFLEAMETFQPKLFKILQDNELSYEEGAIAIIDATAFIVKECTASIIAEEGFSNALYGFIEGSKTVPPIFA
jgi:hypothetical protein